MKGESKKSRCVRKGLHTSWTGTDDVPRKSEYFLLPGERVITDEFGDVHIVHGYSDHHLFLTGEESDKLDAAWRKWCPEEAELGTKLHMAKGVGKTKVLIKEEKEIGEYEW